MEKQSLNILLVDDDDFFSKIVTTQLQGEFKHKVTVVASAFEAKDLLTKKSPSFDVILTDYYMPGMSGLDLLEWMQEENIETPVVMLTAAGTDVVAVEAMKLGAYDYIRKEHLDLQHLGVVIEATRERHQFRIAKTLEDERTREIGLNRVATDKVRDVLNTLTPAMNSALANIRGDIENRGEELSKQLSPAQRSKMQDFLKQIQHETTVLESAIKGLLDLYRMLYAHHAEAKELDRLKQEIEEKAKLY